MYQKIIKLSPGHTAGHVLVYMDRTETDGDVVVIQAWHDVDGVRYIQQEVITCDNDMLPPLIIRDFSEDSAVAFVLSMKF